MNDNPDRGHEDLLPGESFRNIKKSINDEPREPVQAQPAKSLRLEDVSLTRGLRGILNHTEPAMLLIWCALALVGAALLGYLSYRMSGFEGDFLNYQWSQEPMYSSQDANPRSRTAIEILREWGGVGAGIAAFLFGIVGTLLPLWAVGRLIADAIREGNKS